MKNISVNSIIGAVTAIENTIDNLQYNMKTNMNNIFNIEMRLKELDAKLKNIEKQLSKNISSSETDLSNYYTKAETDNKFTLKSSEEGFVTEEELTNKLNTDLSNYYTKAETYSKTEIDNKTSGINSPLSLSNIKVKNNATIEKNENNEVTIVNSLNPLLESIQIKNGGKISDIRISTNISDKNINDSSIGTLSVVKNMIKQNSIQNVVSENKLLGVKKHGGMIKLLFTLNPEFNSITTNSLIINGLNILEEINNIKNKLNLE